MNIIDQTIDNILTYCQLNGKSDDRWCIGNLYDSVTATLKHNILTSNNMFIFNTERTELTQEIIRRAVDEHGFIAEGEITMHRFFYVFRIQKHNRV